MACSFSILIYDQPHIHYGLMQSLWFTKTLNLTTFLCEWGPSHVSFLLQLIILLFEHRPGHPQKRTSRASGEGMAEWTV